MRVFVCVCRISLLFLESALFSGNMYGVVRAVEGIQITGPQSYVDARNETVGRQKNKAVQSILHTHTHTHAHAHIVDKKGVDPLNTPLTAGYKRQTKSVPRTYDQSNDLEK